MPSDAGIPGLVPGTDLIFFCEIISSSRLFYYAQYFPFSNGNPTKQCAHLNESYKGDVETKFVGVSSSNPIRAGLFSLSILSVC